MSIKSIFNQKRDWLQHFIYKVVNPAVLSMIKIGITPNVVTTIGFLGNLAGAVMFCVAATHPLPDGSFDYAMVGWAGFVIIASSLFDMLDGQVARIGNMASRFGAMYDSVLDRYSELVSLGGITYMLMAAGYLWGSIITFAALIGSVMVSYVRARAEGLGIDCKVGFMQRPERVVVTALGAIATGVVGVSLRDTNDFDAMTILIVAMAIIAVFANITAFARVAHCRRELTRIDGPVKKK